MAIQIDLFSDLFSIENTIEEQDNKKGEQALKPIRTEKAEKAAKPVKEKPEPLELPEFIKLNKETDLYSLMKAARIGSFGPMRNKHLQANISLGILEFGTAPAAISAQELRYGNSSAWNYGRWNFAEFRFEFSLYYIERKGRILSAKATVEGDGDLYISPYRISGRTQKPRILKAVVSPFKGVKPGALPLHGGFLLQSRDELLDILGRRSEYTKKFCILHNDRIEPEDLLFAPQLEFLWPWQFVQTEAFRRNPEEFNRLTGAGKNSKEIFKTTAPVYKLLRDESALETWDFMRKMLKTGKVTKEQLSDLYDMGISAKYQPMVSAILGAKYNGSPVYTLGSLNAYLRRVDLNEAIPQYEALPLLRDYLSMCQDLGIKPKTDSDSLKREHDVTARLVYQKRDELRKINLDAECKKSARFDYKEQIYFARAIKSWDDLADEAGQQHNCVLSYADRIAKGISQIFVVRLTANPDRSLVTVELNKDGTIVQKFLAFNQPIRNKSLSDFIDRFQKHVRDVQETEKRQKRQQKTA